MLINLTQLNNNSTIDCDVCIVGSGPAAISIALELKDTGKSIIMITGGGWSETAFNQDLNRGLHIHPHEPLEENRRRQFGGASAAWGGRCIPLDPIDFEERAWIPHSGWPITHNDLDSYYIKATQLCLAGGPYYDARKLFPNAPKEIIPGIDDDNILSWPLEKWSPPINFATHYKDILEGSANIQVLLDANVTSINSTGEKQKISDVTVVAGDKTLTVVAGTFVIAAGGIENPRLLLASKSANYPNGIGNDHDNVGRYYMSHIMSTYADIDVANRDTLNYDFEKEDDVYCRRRWWVSEVFQRQEKIGNAILFLHQPQSTNGHRDPLFSAIFLAKSFLSIIKQGNKLAKYKELKPAIKDHGKNLLANGFSMIPQIVSLAMKRFAKRRLPYILPAKKSRSMGLYFQTEHMPNPESRITLSTDAFDALGMPRAVVDVAFTDLDTLTVVKAHRLFMNKYRAIRAGNDVYTEDGLNKHIGEIMQSFNSSAHHLGTTRMANDPKDGVVDSDCKVFGTDNLYVAGSSVFTTGGHVNPTLTIVALAVRLADHLKTVI